MPSYVARIWGIFLHALLVLKLAQGVSTLSANGTSSGQQTDGNIVIREGVLFQTKDCPWAISKAEMRSHNRDSSITGNTIRMRSQAPGRTGNRFVDLSQFLAMGYCCRSKLLVLPFRDDTIPGQDDDHIFTSENNFFDFSTVDTLPLEEFRNISDQVDVCPELIQLRGSSSFRLQGIHPDLLSCMNRVYLRGCEAAYLGGLVATWNFCPARQTPDPSTTSPQGVQLAKEESSSDSGEGAAGSLVMQIRSGDIFGKARVSSRHGQPPLQFYLDTIANQPWSEISIITFAKSRRLVNPTYSRLQKMATQGLLGNNVNFYMNRDFAVDLEAMLCADGIAFARSSLALFLSAQGRASYFYVPSECGPGIYTRQVRSRKAPRVLLDNTTLLALERPDAQVYGIEWKGGQETYGVYKDFKNTPLGRTEMLEFDIEGLKQCHIGD